MRGLASRAASRVAQTRARGRPDRDGSRIPGKREWGFQVSFQVLDFRRSSRFPLTLPVRPAKVDAEVTAAVNAGKPPRHAYARRLLSGFAKAGLVPLRAQARFVFSYFLFSRALTCSPPGCRVRRGRRTGDSRGRGLLAGGHHLAGGGQGARGTGEGEGGHTRRMSPPRA